MPRQQTTGQRKTVRRVMHEFKHRELRSGRGGKVKNPKQAVAIALREAGASKYQSPKENRRSLRRTKRREATGAAGRKTRGRARAQGPTRAALYAEAKRRNIRGRSKMNKAALQRALRR
jgi:hypothetical protein